MPHYTPMRPNPSSVEARYSGGRSKKPRLSAAERAATPPAGWEVVLRPLGYLLVAVVWAALFAVTLALPAMLPLGILADGPDFTTADFILQMGLGSAILGGLITLGLLVPIFGYAFLALPLASGPLAMLALTYVVRSLRPRYRGTRLSSTGWSREALGPVTVFPTALSLIPTISTRWSRFWLGASLLGWVPSKGVFMTACVYGVGYLLTVGWILWPLHSTIAVVIWSVVTAAFVAAIVVMLVREAIRRFGSRLDVRELKVTESPT